MRHIRDHYQDVTDEFRQAPYWHGLDIKAAHVSSYSIAPDADPLVGDYLILTDEGVYHAWGDSPTNIKGKTFTTLTPQEIAELEKAPCLFDACCVWY